MHVCAKPKRRSVHLCSRHGNLTGKSRHMQVLLHLQKEVDQVHAQHRKQHEQVCPGAVAAVAEWRRQAGRGQALCGRRQHVDQRGGQDGAKACRGGEAALSGLWLYLVAVKG